MSHQPPTPMPKHECLPRPLRQYVFEFAATVFTPMLEKPNFTIKKALPREHHKEYYRYGVHTPYVHRCCDQLPESVSCKTSRSGDMQLTPDLSRQSLLVRVIMSVWFMPWVMDSLLQTVRGGRFASYFRQVKSTTNLHLSVWMHSSVSTHTMASTKGPSFSLKSTPFRARILRLDLKVFRKQPSSTLTFKGPNDRLLQQVLVHHKTGEEVLKIGHN